MCKLNLLLVILEEIFVYIGEMLFEGYISILWEEG